MRLPSAVLCLACCVCVAGACTQERSPSKAVVLLFDISASAPQEVRDRYAQWAKEIVRRRDPAPVLGPGDALVLTRVTETSLSEPDLPRLELTAFDPRRSNEMVARARAAKELAGAEVMIDDFLGEDRWARESHILGALDLVARVFKSLRRERNTLVVFSDMIEESDRGDFFRQPLDQASIERIIEQEGVRGRLPELNGVQVYVAGAGVGSYAQSLSGEQQMAIRSFWLRFFETAGAVLPPERYLPTFMGIEP